MYLNTSLVDSCFWSRNEEFVGARLSFIYGARLGLFLMRGFMIFLVLLFLMVRGLVEFICARGFEGARLNWSFCTRLLRLN